MLYVIILHLFSSGQTRFWNRKLNKSTNPISLSYESCTDKQTPSGLPSVSTVSICTASTGQSIVHDVKIMKDCWVYWENSYTITSFSFSPHSLLLTWIMDSDGQSIRKSTHVCGCSCAGRAVCVAPSLLHPLHQPSVCECNGNSGLGGSYIVSHKLEKTHTHRHVSLVWSNGVFQNWFSTKWCIS